MIIKKIESEFIQLLKVSPKLLPEKQIAVAKARLILLGYGDVCSRCAGSGHYSFNLASGTTCFDCGGAKRLPPKLTKKLYALAEPKVVDGTLDLLLEQSAKRVARRKQMNAAPNTFLASWKAMGVEYDWELAAKKIEPHHRISCEVNAPVSRHLDVIQEACRAASSIDFKIKNATDAKVVEALEIEFEAAITAAIKALEDGLELIESQKQLYADIKAEQPAG
jgi:hypothetical protein